MSEVVLYTSDDGRTRLDLCIDGQSVWLTQLESVAAKDQKVGFNLSGSKQIRFRRTADFTKQLRENLERHFKFKQ
jgi:hypothetical protein